MTRTFGFWGAALLIVAASAGCKKGSGTAEGQVRSQPLQVKDAIYFTQMKGLVVPDLETPGKTSQRVAVLLTDASGACEAIQKRAMKKGVSSLVMVIGRRDAVGGVKAQKYPTVSAIARDFESFGVASIDRKNDKCESVIPSTERDATGGSISLGQVPELGKGMVSGEYELQFGADKIAGRFEAKFCDAKLDLFDFGADEYACND